MSSQPQQPSPPAGETKKISGVIVTHGHLAGELLAAAEMIIGPVSHIASVSIGWHDDVDAARDEVQRAITRVSQGAGILLLTDMFGGTPTNIASMFLVSRTSNFSNPLKILIKASFAASAAFSYEPK